MALTDGVAGLLAAARAAGLAGDTGLAVGLADAFLLGEAAGLAGEATGVLPFAAAGEAVTRGFFCGDSSS